MIEVSAYHGCVLSGQNLLYIIQDIQLLIYNEDKRPNAAFELGEGNGFMYKVKAWYGGLRVRWSQFEIESPNLVVASNFSIVKEVEAVMDPAAFTVVRFAMSAVPFIPFVFRARDDVHTRNAGIELGFWVSLGYLMQALGLLTSDAGRASFLSMFTVSL